MPASEPTAALTSPVAVIAAILLLVAMIIAAVGLQTRDSREAGGVETPQPLETSLAVIANGLPTSVLVG